MASTAGFILKAENPVVVKAMGLLASRNLILNANNGGISQKAEIRGHRDLAILPFFTICQKALCISEAAYLF